MGRAYGIERGNLPVGLGLAGLSDPHFSYRL